MRQEKALLSNVLTHQGLASGYSFRGRIVNEDKGSVRVIQLKDFENNYTSIGNHCYLVDGTKIKEKYYLTEGDILFIAKGTNNFAVTFNPIDSTPTIASSALFVIRVDRNIVNPYYLTWYINQTKAQNYLKQHELGTYIPSINKATLEGMSIELPSLEVQYKIAKLSILAIKEYNLRGALNELINQLTQHQLMSVVNKI